MERVLRVAKDFDEADEFDLDDWLRLSGDERVRIGEQMREELWPTADRGLERVLRVVELPQR